MSIEHVAGRAVVHTVSGDVLVREALHGLAVNSVSGDVTVGEVAGDLSIDRRARDLTRWSANFLLRNADVAKLAAGAKSDDAAPAVGELRGELNASLAIEGGWGEDGKSAQAIPRRGRGDISISGERMLNVPMVLGITQIVSLSLPFTEDGTPSEGELRIAQAQLVGWLEGLFHGIQTAIYAQQMAARGQLEQMRRALPAGAGQAQGQPVGMPTMPAQEGTSESGGSGGMYL